MDCIHILEVGMVPRVCGGVEVFMMNIYRNIDRSKVQLDFLIYDTNERLYFEDEIESLGGTVYRDYYSALKHPIKRIKSLYQLLKKHPEIKGVHYHATALFYIDILIIAKLLKRDIRIIHSHNTGYDKKDYFFVLNIFHSINKKLIKIFCTHFFACSKTAGKWMFGNKSFSVIPNAIDVNKYKFNNELRGNYRNEFGIADDEICIGVIGRLAYQKNPIFMIELMNYLKKNCEKKFKMIMVGDGELKSEIVDLLDKYELQDNVLLLGNRNDISKLINSFDIYLFPSIYEGFPLSLLEAQANGVPCLISEKITEEVVINENVYRCNLNDGFDVWMKQIETIIKEKCRIDNSKNLINMGYDISKMAYDMEKIYIGQN